jgi:hypothetical protein
MRLIEESIVRYQRKYGVRGRRARGERAGGGELPTDAATPPR